MLQTDHAIWWSPSGKHFLYAVFNDTPVTRYDLVYYGDPTDQYVDNKRLSYPKVCPQILFISSGNNISVQFWPLYLYSKKKQVYWDILQGTLYA